MRGEVQELLHQTFNLIESARREVHDESSRPLEREEQIFVERLSEIVGLLGETYEQLRSRVLPIIG